MRATGKDGQGKGVELAEAVSGSPRATTTAGHGVDFFYLPNVSSARCETLPLVPPSVFLSPRTAVLFFLSLSLSLIIKEKISLCQSVGSCVSSFLCTRFVTGVFLL